MADKTPLILSGIDDNSCTRLNSGSTMENGVVKIRKQLHFKVPNGQDPRKYSDLDVYSHSLFPQRYSVLAANPLYKFYGNASVSHELDDGHYFTADLEYSSENPNATDLDGNLVNHNTPPWKLRPTEINFTYPEVRVAFQMAYDDDGELKVPVVNSAGDPIPLETTVRDTRMSFTFNASENSWDPGYAITYGNTLNSDAINVCGLTIPAEKGLLLPPECSFITVYYDNSTNIKWKYWSVRINILFDSSGLLFNRKVIDIGNRAYFDEIPVSDDLVEMTLPAVSKPEQICAFRLFEKTTGESHYTFTQTGERVFASWSQFIAYRQEAISRSLIKKNESDSTYYGGVVDPQCEQLERMFLRDGYMIDPDEEEEEILSFREYPSISWTKLNLPKKGIA